MMTNTDRSFRLRFHWQSFVAFVILFLIEVCIALFVEDKIIRPYGGDFLVVIMMYFFLKSFIKTKVNYLLSFVLLFAYAIEIGQLFDMVSLLGVEDIRVMRVVLGTSFSWGDMIAYTLGVLTCYLIEKINSKEVKE